MPTRAEKGKAPAKESAAQAEQQPDSTAKRSAKGRAPAKEKPTAKSKASPKAKAPAKGKASARSGGSKVKKQSTLTIRHDLWVKEMEETGRPRKKVCQTSHHFLFFFKPFSFLFSNSSNYCSRPRQLEAQLQRQPQLPRRNRRFPLLLLTRPRGN